MKKKILFLIPLCSIAFMSFSMMLNTELEIINSPFDHNDSLEEGVVTTTIALVGFNDSQCMQVHVNVQEKRGPNMWMLASGKVYIGEDCGHKSFFGEIEEGGFVETTLASAIENRVEVSYAIKSWYYDFEAKRNGDSEDSLTVDVYLVQPYEYDCAEVFMMVNKTVGRQTSVHDFGKLTVGEGCAHDELYGNIDIANESPKNLAETIENKLEVSYAIKKWYYDFMLKEKTQRK